MAPILFKIPLTIPFYGPAELPIYGFGIMLVMAFIFAPWLAWWRARREGLDGDLIWDMGFWIFVAGLVGARAEYCREYWGRDIHNLLEALQYWRGGIVYYGGIVGGVVGFFAYRWFNPFPVRPYVDAIAPSIALGTFFGRLGCFLNGCCYGDQCRLPWAVSFPVDSAPWWHQVKAGLIAQGATASLPVHPTQLYSALDGLILLVLLTAYYPLRRRDGEVMGLLMIAYPITRFLIEYLRNDEAALIAGLTISQAISVFLLLAAAVYWAWLGKQLAGRQAVGAAQSKANVVEPAAV
jgi:phosphatidylglycerol---prolipoprotein diacylglyceryl transferase